MWGLVQMKWEFGKSALADLFLLPFQRTAQPVLGLFLENKHLIFLGLALIVFAFVLRRSYKKVQKSALNDPHQNAQNRLVAAEQSAAGRVNKLETRLHNYGREIEGRMETRIAMLDRLLQEADQKVAELTVLLEQASQQVGNAPTLPAAAIAEKQLAHMMDHLRKAGYSHQEIARLTKRTTEEVTAALSMSASPKTGT